MAPIISIGNNKRFIGVIDLTDNIKKPSWDHCEYRCCELSNGLKVQIVSDPSTNVSTACMRVKAGSWTDPENLPGLAHYTEHLISMGTSKYPDENYWDVIVKKHGGYSHAATSDEYTHFSFGVQPRHLNETLDVFAQCFISPLFNRSSMERELKAVQSEYEDFCGKDEVRSSYVDYQFSKPQSDYRKFRCGNTKTLKSLPEKNGVDVRTKIKEYFKLYYSSENMTLAILGRQSLDHLTVMVAKHFGEIKRNLNCPKYIERMYPLRSNDLKILIKYASLSSAAPRVAVKFALPDLTKKLEFSYVSFLLNHKGSGSLISSLKSKGLGISVQTVSSSDDEDHGFGWYIVYVYLTELGLARVYDVVTSVFCYINTMCRDRDPEPQIYRAMGDDSDQSGDSYDSAANVRENEDPVEYVQFLATALAHRSKPVKEILSDLRPFDREFSRECTSKYLRPENCRVMVESNLFDSRGYSSEQWLGGRYCFENIPGELIAKWSDVVQEGNEFRVPNIILLTDVVSLFSETEPDVNIGKLCIIETGSPQRRLWFKQDNSFNAPETFMMFQFTSPIANDVIMDLFVFLLDDSLQEIAAEFRAAKLYCDLISKKNGFELLVGGFSQMLDRFLRVIIDHIKTFHVHLNQSQIDRQIRSYENPLNFTALGWARESRSHLLKTDFVSAEDVSTALKAVNVATLQKIISDFFNGDLYVEALMQGNITRKLAVEALQTVEELTTGCRRLQLPPVFSDKRLSSGSFPSHPAEPSEHQQSCVLVTFQLEKNRHNSVLLELLHQIIEEPFFNFLRTKNQLGYKLGISHYDANSFLYMEVHVTAQHDLEPEWIGECVEAFIDHVHTILSGLDKVTFRQHVESLLNDKKLRQPKSLWEEFKSNWEEISSRDYQSDRKAQDAAYLAKVTKKDLIKFYHSYIHQGGPNRAQLSVHVTRKKSNAGSQGTIQFVKNNFFNIFLLIAAPMCIWKFCSKR